MEAKHVGLIFTGLGLIVAIIALLWGNNLLGRKKHPVPDKTTTEIEQAESKDSVESDHNSSEDSKTIFSFFNKEKIKAIIYLDKSASYANNPNYKLTWEELNSVIRNMPYRGEISLAVIDESSKKYYTTYRPNSTPNALYFMADTIVKEILNYDLVSNHSNIYNAVEYAELKFNEPTSKTEEIRKVAIFVTDGKHDTQFKSQYINDIDSFCCEMLVVSNSKNVNDLNRFNPKIFTNVTSAIEYAFD